MGTSYNRQQIPGGNLRSADSWTTITKRQAQAEKTRKKLRKKTDDSLDDDLADRANEELLDNMKDFGVFED